MRRFLIRFLLMFAALALVGGACTSSGDDDDAAEDEDQSEVDETTDEDPSDDEADSDDDDGRANAIGVIEDMGFSGEGAECIVDSLEDSGVDLAELDLSDAADPGGDLGDALAHAGADCAEVIGDDLPAGSTDLSNPQVYDAFVQGFATSSGLSIEVATCVADYLLENDIDPSEAVSGDGAAFTDALNECQ